MALRFSGRPIRTTRTDAMARDGTDQMDRKDLLPGDASPSSAGMGTNAPLRDAGSMKTWKKPHAVAGMVLVVTLVATGALIAAANSGDGAAALTSKRRSQLAVARAEERQSGRGTARPSFDGVPHDGDKPDPSDDRRQVDPASATTSISTTSTTVDDR